MNQKTKYTTGIVLSVLVICALTIPAFALTESDVQSQVSASGKEGVAGNLFVWFLCAVAFLKISQKIDSFMQGLGINVGHMKNVTCSIVEDLLPLYMDGCCSKDSQQAVAEHMKTCEKCRETYRHLQSDLPTIANETTDMRSEEIARSLSKRIKKRKAAAVVFAVIFFVFAMISLFFVGKAIMIMRGQGSQVSLGSLESAVNLSEGDFSCSAQDIGAYSFFTNTTRIIIRTDAPLDETVTVRLWNTENMSENILLARLDKNQKICTFTHLSSRNRYAITVDNMPDISISVSSRLTFWEALSRALQNE